MSKKLKIIPKPSANQKTLLYLFIGIIVLSMFAIPYLEDQKVVKAILTLLAVGYVLFFLVYRVFVFIKHNFINTQYLILLEDTILVGEESYRLEDIESMAIKSSNVRGYNIGDRKDRTGRNNFFKIRFSTSEVVEYEFLQTRNTRIKGFKKALLNYYKLEKISWKQLIKILELEHNEAMILKKNLD